jgi:hypothetical protein
MTPDRGAYGIHVVKDQVFQAIDTFASVRDFLIQPNDTGRN